jgi:hypothetical protein
MQLKRSNQRSFGMKKTLQSGQAILFIAMTMVGLIGALGLAIDGGGLLFMYRDIQNATDAAVVAATYARCTNGDVTSAGLAAAAQNGFNNDGVTNWVTVNNPPTSGEGAGDINFVEINIRALKASYFIQLVYPQPLEVVNGSVGHCRPAFNPTNVGAVFGISETCNNPSAVNFQGADLQIIGSVHSNQELKFNGSNQFVDGTGTYRLSASGGVTYSGGTAQITQPLPDPLAGYFARRVFDAGGRVYERALAKSMQLRGDASLVHIVTGNLTSSNLEGYYVVSGNVDVSNAVFGPAGATIIANGTIDFHTTREANYFVDGLLLYSGANGGCNGQGVISFRGPNGNGGGGNGNSSRTCGPGIVPDPDRQLMRGVIYAPNGGINFSVPRANMVGALVAQFVSSSAARSCIWYEPSILDPIPPQVEFAQ